MRCAKRWFPAREVRPREQGAGTARRRRVRIRGGRDVGWAHRSLIRMRDLTAEDIVRILDTAAACKDIFRRAVKKLPTLRGQVMVNLFYEPSTRTRTSFELAGKWMSADVVNIAVPSSSVVKGESVTDTARTLAALGADIVVIRHPAAGVPAMLARSVGAAVINAGDGMHEHPTQALLDIFTIRECRGTLAGLHVLIVGDILHSRVARSNIWGLKRLGARVTVAGPPTLIPSGLERLGVGVSHDLDRVLPRADVVNVLRIQRERQTSGLFPSLREYTRLFGLTRERLQLLKPDALILHPGPANVGVEIDREVMDDPRARIEEQVTNGVAVRMAVLYLLMGGRQDAMVA
ncbi:MAG: aspartate carbamoyltransferase catalytic subunit [Firmicutes bacterium]|nr:aspartate carbamoyltransferase catalytic subunit [Bacillota bacterium]